MTDALYRLRNELVSEKLPDQRGGSVRGHPSFDTITIVPTWARSLKKHPSTGFLRPKTPETYRYRAAQEIERFFTRHVAIYA